MHFKHDYVGESGEESIQGYEVLEPGKASSKDELWSQILGIFGKINYSKPD